MRTVAGLVAFHALVLSVGLAFLLAVRLARPRPGDLLRSLGLAHLAGVAATCLASIWLLVLGGTVTAPVFAGIALALSAGLLAIAVLRPGGLRSDEPSPATGRAPSQGWPVVVLGAAIALFLAVQIWNARELPTAWDAAHNWTLKAVVLVNDGDLSSGAFRDPKLFGGAHQDYPILQPVLGSVALRFASRSDQSLLVAELWLLVAAFVAAVAYLLRGRLGWTVLLFAPLAIAIASGPAQGVMRGDADVAMAVFLATGVLCLGLWVERARPGLLPAAALLLGAAANVKNEGTVFAIVVMVAALCVSIGRPARDLRAVGLATVAVVAAAVPWRLWVAAHGPFPSDVRSLGDSLSPSLLWDSLHQLDFAAREILARLADGTGSGWLFPAFLLVTLVLLSVRRDRRVHALYLAAGLAMIAALLWIYWTSPQPDVEAHIERTTLRTVTAPMFVAAVALAHILSRLRPEVRSAREAGEG